jgi:hypothetical protein
MIKPPLLRCFAIVGAALAIVLCTGCLYSGSKKSPEEEARVARERARAAGAFQSSLTNEHRRISVQELDQLTYGYADRFYMVMSSAVDAIKRNNPDPVQRRVAHQIKLNGVMAINDIVSGNDPYSRTLDLVVAVTLQSMVLIDENGAERAFGDRAPGLIHAIRMMRLEAWELAAKVLTQEQLDLLDYIILEWRRTHKEIEQVAFVKFDNFAGVRAAALLSEFQAGHGFLAPLSEASQVMKDWARLTERAFWYSKRAPNLASIEAEGAVNEILSAPEINSLVHTADRLGSTAESLPQVVEAQRNAIVADLDAHQALLTNSLADLRHIVSDADSLGRTMSLLTTNFQQTLASLNETIRVADEVGRRFGLDQPSTNPPARPFDIQDYAAALARLNEVITNAEQLSLNADRITRGPGWNKGMQDFKDAADQRLDHALRNICVALCFGFVLTVLYKVISLLLARRILPANREKT